jgi:hypothetical protein
MQAALVHVRTGVTDEGEHGVEHGHFNELPMSGTLACD